MADDKDDDDDDDGDKGDKFPPKKKPGGGTATILDVIDALRETGMSIPEEVTDELGLVIAIKSNGSSGGDDDLGLGGGDGGGAPEGTAGANSPPMMMSDRRAEPFKKMARRDLETRARNLFSSGRVDRPTAKRLILESRSVNLSFTRAGELAANPVASRIEAFETLPAKSAWSKTGGRPIEARDLSDTREIDVPDKLDGGDTSKGTEEATALILGMIAGPPAKK